MNRHWSDGQDREALKRGAEKLRFEPRAKRVRYDRSRRQVIIELASGASFAFPPRLVEGLAGASSEALSAIEVDGVGFTLHWPELDVDYTVGGLISGVFGTAQWMAAKAGQAQSAKKAAAARANGRKGGRPRKSAAPGLGAKHRLVTAEQIAHEYGLSAKSYRARLREARLDWHDANARWEVEPASAEQSDMLSVAEAMKARQREDV